MPPLWPSILMVVPARSGSKGLPRKNALPLAGKPLLEWTYAAVKQAGILDRVSLVLSTDSVELAEIGKNVGLQVPFLRPAELAQDETLAGPVAIHALDWYRDQKGQDPDLIFWLQPTSPFRRPERFVEALDCFKENSDLTAVLGVKELNRHLGMLYYADSLGQLDVLDKSASVDTRRQTMRRLFTPNGALYAIRTPAFRRSQYLSSAPVKSIVMDQIESIDIDDSKDFAIALALAESGRTWRGEMPC